MSTENVCCVGRGAIHQSRCFSALALSGNSKCLQMFTKARSSSKLTSTLMSTPLVLKATHARAQDPTGAHQSEAVLFRSCRLLAPAASALATTDCLITANPIRQGPAPCSTRSNHDTFGILLWNFQMFLGSPTLQLLVLLTMTWPKVPLQGKTAHAEAERSWSLMEMLSAASLQCLHTSTM